jgi:hypothetical protein
VIPDFRPNLKAAEIERRIDFGLVPPAQVRKLARSAAD